VIAGLIRLLTGAQARWTGCAPDPVQRIYFANHTSHLDFPVIWASLPPALRLLTRPVAARDYWDATRLRRYLAKDVFRAIMIERNAAGRDNPLRPMEEALSAGDSLIIFPEARARSMRMLAWLPSNPAFTIWPSATPTYNWCRFTWKISTASCPRANTS
jgi:1-acyl-sn-glycerol-3-phosphate acyltransferase